MPCPPPGDILDPGIEPKSPALQADSLPSEPPGKPMCLWVITSVNTGFCLSQMGRMLAPACPVVLSDESKQRDASPHLLKRPQSRTLAALNADESVEQQELPGAAGKDAKGADTSEDGLAVSHNTAHGLMCNQQLCCLVFTQIYSRPEICPQMCCCSVAQSCLTLRDPTDCSTPGFPVLYYLLLEFAQTHVH